MVAGEVSRTPYEAGYEPAGLPRLPALARPAGDDPTKPVLETSPPTEA